MGWLLALISIVLYMASGKDVLMIVAGLFAISGSIGFLDLKSYINEQIHFELKSNNHNINEEHYDDSHDDENDDHIGD